MNGTLIAIVIVLIILVAAGMWYMNRNPMPPLVHVIKEESPIVLYNTGYPQNYRNSWNYPIHGWGGGRRWGRGPGWGGGRGRGWGGGGRRGRSGSRGRGGGGRSRSRGRR